MIRLWPLQCTMIQNKYITSELILGNKLYTKISAYAR